MARLVPGTITKILERWGEALLEPLQIRALFFGCHRREILSQRLVWHFSVEKTERDWRQWFIITSVFGRS
ncbi:MAG: hypothetical protein C4346_08345 [Chloroflexota bacterium]